MQQVLTIARQFGKRQFPNSTNLFTTFSVFCDGSVKMSKAYLPKKIEQTINISKKNKVKVEVIFLKVSSK